MQNAKTLGYLRKCLMKFLRGTSFSGLWSAKICGYAKVRLVNEALDMLREMLKMGVEPDKGWLP